ncbi:hypothetical protein LZ30DRAFT_732312 [Colletotrichum cereale]|nr:hypothetical protein LZ30DRAFT_732312 [Colletotrichum cereale]
MEKSGSHKRKQQTSDQIAGSSKWNRDEGSEGHPLDGLLKGLRRTQQYAELAQNPDFADKNFDADVRNEMLNLGEELDRLELGLAASKTASYESILELSSWQMAEMLRNAGAKGPKHDDGINLFDLIDKPDHEVEEEAAAKAEQDWEDLENEVDECFAPRDYPTRLFFKEFVTIALSLTIAI